MALTDSEKQEIIYSLGYPAKSLVPGTTNYSRILASRFDDVPEFIENKVRQLLCQIRAVDAKLGEATSRFAATQIQDITVNIDESRMLERERRRLIRLIAQAMDINPQNQTGQSFGVSI